MTLHISAASIQGLLVFCAIAHSPVIYNYLPLHGDSAADVNLEANSRHRKQAVVMLLMVNQADSERLWPNNKLIVQCVKMVNGFFRFDFRNGSVRKCRIMHFLCAF